MVHVDLNARVGYVYFENTFPFNVANAQPRPANSSQIRLFHQHDTIRTIVSVRKARKHSPIYVFFELVCDDRQQFQKLQLDTLIN